MIRLNRLELRKLIGATLNEGYESVQPSVGEMYGVPGMYWGKESDFKYVSDKSIQGHQQRSKQSPAEYLQDVIDNGQKFQVEKVRKALDLAAGAPKKGGESSSMYKLLGPDGGAPLGPPLSTNELMALIMADKDPSSSYKLSRERLGMVNKDNLTPEEQSLINSI